MLGTQRSIELEVFPVEMLDEYMHLQSVSNDHQIRAIVRFKSHLDLEILKKSVMITSERIPLLGCMYVRKRNKRYWQRKEFISDDYIRIHTFESLDTNYVDILAEIPNELGPQILLRVFRNNVHDLLVVTVNHMIFDGTGLKEYLYLLARVYSGIETEVSLLDRQLGTLLRNITLLETIRAIFDRPQEIVEPSFLKIGEGTSPTKLNILRISGGELKNIKEFCKAHNATVNDFVIAALANSIFEIDTITDSVSMQMMVDLRRYIKRHKPGEFGNFASMETVSVNKESGNFVKLLISISEKTRKMKSGLPGLRNILLMKLVWTFLSLNTFDILLKNEIKKFPISTSNLGVIETDKMVFGSNRVDDAFMLTSIKKQPAMQLTFSTFMGTMTLSILGEYSEENSNNISKCLGGIKREIQRTAE